MSSTLNDHVNRLVAEIIKNVYNPKLFRKQLAKNGGDAQKTITRMLTPSTRVQEGFIKLSNAHRLDLSIEALVLYSDFTNEFSDEVKKEARRRLQGSNVTTAWK